MAKPINRVSDKKGLPPGSLVHIGREINTESKITVLKYNIDELLELEIKSIKELIGIIDDNHTLWVNISGQHNIDLIKDIGTHFDIHSLVLEDILNTNQRIKFEDHDEYIFLVMKRHIQTQKEIFKFSCEQVSILTLKNIVFSFSESTFDSDFKYLRERLSNPKSRIRGEKSSYLTYAIMDTLVDQYFNLLDQLDDITESIDNDLLNTPDNTILRKIQQVKRELILIRKSVSPLRETLLNILKSESFLIDNKTDIYFKDVYDHILRILESLDMYRELTSNLLEIYLTNISNRMNAVMKVLTIFASIFIPLTFIAGVYGMNFKYMPELEWKWSYPAIWCVFIIIALLLIVFFKRKKWF